ncbi:MAG: hypothetical protein ACYSWO_26620 [Planctomycetota bacterium]|jgi:hypothetical protein
MPQVILNRIWQPMLPSEVDPTTTVIIAMRGAHLPGWPDCQILTAVPRGREYRWAWVQLAPPFDSVAACDESWDEPYLAMTDKMQKGWRVHACRNLDEFWSELQNFAEHPQYDE